MLLSEAVCPDQRDPRYVPTYDISTREFGDAIRAWQREIISGAELLKMLGQLHENGREWLDSAQAEHLRNAVEDNTLQLLSVSKFSNADQSGLNADYTLLMRDQIVHPNHYVVYVGERSGREQVIAISTAVR